MRALAGRSQWWRAYERVEDGQTVGRKDPAPLSCRALRAECPEEPTDDDVRYLDELVQVFIDRYTAIGDLGATPLLGSEQRSQLPLAGAVKRSGVELLDERVSFIQQGLPAGATVHAADARTIGQLGP